MDDVIHIITLHLWVDTVRTSYIAAPVCTLNTLKPEYVTLKFQRYLKPWTYIYSISVGILWLLLIVAHTYSVSSSPRSVV